MLTNRDRRLRHRPLEECPYGVTIVPAAVDLVPDGEEPGVGGRVVGREHGVAEDLEHGGVEEGEWIAGSDDREYVEEERVAWEEPDGVEERGGGERACAWDW